MKLQVEYDGKGFWEVDRVKFDNEGKAKEYLTFLQAKHIIITREWYPFLDESYGEWMANGADLMMFITPTDKDPFVAIIKTEQWYKENIENKG